MSHVRAALYLDFDNVFSGLYKLDPDAAVKFASDPGAWLRRLSTTLTTDAPRRWLVLRCYLNPAGWVPHRGPSGEPTRWYFSRFRQSFVRAGFEVIDCPRYNATKNGADIRMVIDAVDALSAEIEYQEFVIVSGDSDMTPLLQRIRRADRRTMIVFPVVAADAYTSIADRALDSQHLLALVQGERVDFDDEDDEDAAGADGAAEAMTAAIADVNGRPARVSRLTTGAIDEAYKAFRSSVTAEYYRATTALNMAGLAKQLRDELGEVVKESGWFGFGGFRRAVESLGLPNLRISQHHLWDDTRHPAPAIQHTADQRTLLPEPVERLAETIDLPRLPRESWRPIYQALSEYTPPIRQPDAVHELVPSPAAGAGFASPEQRRLRRARHLNRWLPALSATAADRSEIGTAFVENVLNHADLAELALTDDEIAVVRSWLGADT